MKHDISVIPGEDGTSIIVWCADCTEELVEGPNLTPSEVLDVERRHVQRADNHDG